MRSEQTEIGVNALPDLKLIQSNMVHITDICSDVVLGKRQNRKINIGRTSFKSTLTDPQRHGISLTKLLILLTNIENKTKEG